MGSGRRDRHVGIALLLAMALLTTCGQGAEDPPPVPSPTEARRHVTVPATARPPQELPAGLSLLPGDDGKLPVRLRWVKSRDVPIALGVHDGIVYVLGPRLTAFNLDDGTVAWTCCPIESEDGAVKIGLDGPDIVRVFAPENFDLRADRRSGRQLSMKRTARREPPPDFVLLPAPEPTRFRVTADLEEIVGSWPDGRVAWRLKIDAPFVDPLGPVQAGDAIVLVTADQHVVVLDPVA